MRLWETPSDIQTYNFQFLSHIGKFNKIIIKKSHFESLKFARKKDYLLVDIFHMMLPAKDSVLASRRLYLWQTN